MIAKILKRKVSRVAFEAPDPSQLSISGNANHATSTGSGLSLQYEYKRPDLLGPLTEEEAALYSSHLTRPVLTPKTPLPPGIGYAEAINAGKSKYNEDQV